MLWCIVLIIVVGASASVSCAQSAIPTLSTTESTSQAPVTAAAWPLKWPFQKQTTGNAQDPFLGYGAEQQRRMAMQISGQQLTPAGNQSAAKYPWPSPVDSHAHLPLGNQWGAAPPVTVSAAQGGPAVHTVASPTQPPMETTSPAVNSVPTPQPPSTATALTSTPTASANSNSVTSGTTNPTNASSIYATPPPTTQPAPTPTAGPTTSPASASSIFSKPSPPPTNPPTSIAQTSHAPAAAGSTPPASRIQIAAPPVPQPVSRGELEPSSRVLAIVGDQSILYGDIAGQINEMLAPYEGQVPEEALQVQREALVQRFLPRVVDNKLLFLDLLRKVPPDKMPEIEQDIFKQYNETQLPKLLKETGLQTAAELDDYLRGMGSSLAKQQRLFLEHVMRNEAVRTHVKVDKEVSHEEMLEYYREHVVDFQFEAKSRWERLMVYKSNFDSPAAAHQALVQMGNEVLGGAPFDAVARRSSQGPNAATGGQYDWTTRGSLRSQQIDELIFTLPPGKLSRIVEDEEGYHILRVVERIDAGKQPFAEAQDTIKDKIREKRFDQQADEYLERLRKETYVWTAFDNAQPVTQATFSN